MRTTPWIMLAIAAAALSPWGVPGGPAGASEEPRPEVAEEMDLHAIMEEIGERFGRLKRSVRDEEQRDATLANLVELQKLAWKAKTRGLPEERLPPDRRDAAALDFRLRQIALLRHLLDAEQAVLEKRTADAFDLVKQMVVLKREAHEVFEVDD